jgi:hypothetical protein
VAVDVSGEHRFKAPIDIVWQTLFDASALKASIPGCEELRQAAPGVHVITAHIGVSAVKGRYTGEVRVVEAARPSLYRLAMSGSGAPGVLHGEARFDLREAPGGTVVAYRGDLKAQGALARVGGQVLSGAAKLMIGQFFKEMERQVRDRTP